MASFEVFNGVYFLHILELRSWMGVCDWLTGRLAYGHAWRCGFLRNDLMRPEWFVFFA